MSDQNNSDEPTGVGAIPFIIEHLALYDTDPERAHMWDSTITGGLGPVPTLVLTSIGSKSGKARRSPLIYHHFKGGYVVAASKGGWPTDPVWYINIQGTTQCEVQVAADKFTANWRLLDDGERAELWPTMVEVFPPYADYAAATERVIPLLLLQKA